MTRRQCQVDETKMLALGECVETTWQVAGARSPPSCRGTSPSLGHRRPRFAPKSWVRFAKTAFGHRPFARSFPAANGRAFAMGPLLARV